MPVDPPSVSLYPAPPAELSSGSIVSWLLVATVLAIVVAVGLVLASRR